MIWFNFLLSALIVAVAATKLAEYGDWIAFRANLNGMFVGTLFLAGATSLPELLSAVNAIQINEPNLAAGSMFGSGLFNMFMLALLDLIFQKARILRKVATTHALTASLAVLATGLASLFLLVNIDIKMGWIGLDSLVIIGIYILGVQLLRNSGSTTIRIDEPKDLESSPSLRRALIGFGIASIILVIVTPWMVVNANQIAECTGISKGFIGATLIAITTSLPELVATIAATRLGSYDLAVGNLFGSNLFNMFALGLIDLFYIRGRFLNAIDPSFAVVGMLVVIVTSLGLIGNLARIERRLLFVEMDALFILVGYLAGMYILYSLGIGA